MDYISDRNLGRRPCEDIPTAGAAGARDDAGAPKSEENLLDVVSWKAFLARDLPPIYRAEIGPLGEVERANHAVLGPGRYSHTLRIDINAVGDKGRNCNSRRRNL
jgi:hypothetical protein